MPNICILHTKVRFTSILYIILIIPNFYNHLSVFFSIFCYTFDDNHAKTAKTPIF